MRRLAVCVILTPLLAGLAAPPVAAGQPQAHVETPAQAPAQELVAEVRVHGNYRTPDADILAIAGLAVGQPIDAAGIDAIVARLKKSGRFESVEVRKRLRSLEATDQVAIIIIVQEYPSTAPGGALANPMKRITSSMMVLPVLEGQDGYGFTYGGRISFVRAFGRKGMLTVPLTWGGTRQAVAEADVTVDTGPVRRLRAGGGIISRHNPAYDERDFRQTAWAEVTMPAWKALSLGARASWAAVDFGTLHDNLATGGVGLALDTRANPAFPRNAIYASAWWTRVAPDRSGSANRYRIDARAYLGLVGKPVLAVRVLSDRSDAVLPEYERPMLGGMDSLRGFQSGAFTGNNLGAGSVELRLPWNSPMRLAQTGFILFYDAGRVWEYGGRLGSARTQVGYGGGWYATAPLVQLAVDVAYGRESGWRVHARAGIRF